MKELWNSLKNKNIFRFIAILKNYGQRSMQYFGFVNSFLIIMTYISVNEYGLSGFIVLPILVVLVLIIGALDHYFILKNELEHVNSKNDLKNDLVYIKEKLKKLEEQP